MEKKVKVKYTGESFFLGLTDGKIYDAIDCGHGTYRVWDDEEFDWYLYGKKAYPADGSSKGGVLEVVEEL